MIDWTKITGFDWGDGNSRKNEKHGVSMAESASLRLPQHLLDSIKAAANARDVPYQSLIKVWLQEKLHGH